MNPAYQSVLGIQPHELPPTYYRLLGLPPGPHREPTIAAAARETFGRLHPHLSGPLASDVQALFREVSEAQATLLDPQRRRQYDEQIGLTAAGGSPGVGVWHRPGPRPGGLQAPSASAPETFVPAATLADPPVPDPPAPSSEPPAPSDPAGEPVEAAPSSVAARAWSWENAAALWPWYLVSLLSVGAMGLLLAVVIAQRSVEDREQPPSVAKQTPEEPDASSDKGDPGDGLLPNLPGTLKPVDADPLAYGGDPIVPLPPELARERMSQSAQDFEPPSSLADGSGEPESSSPDPATRPDPVAPAPAAEPVATLASVPATFSLPESKATQPVVLTALHVPRDDALGLKLLGGASTASGRFQLRALAESEPAWSVDWGPDQGPSQSVGRFDLAENSLRFQWADAPPPEAEALQNCCLLLALSDERKAIPLRRPLAVKPLAVTVDADESRTRLDVPQLPPQIELEIGDFDGPLEHAVVKPERTIRPGKRATLVLAGAARGVELEIDFPRPTGQQVRLEVQVMVRVGKRAVAYREAETKRQLELLRERKIQFERQALAAQEQLKRDRRRLDVLLAAQQQQRAVLDMQLETVERVVSAIDDLVANGAIPFRITTSVEGQKVVLVEAA